jgi:anthranilate phosphoribosyltransferase
VAEKLAAALHALGSERALVVCGNDELDEVSLWGETVVFEVSPKGVSQMTWSAELLGLPECRVEALRVHSAEESAAIIRRVFAGDSGPARDIVVANAGAALLAANRAPTIQAAVELAGTTISSGAAASLCDRLAQWTQKTV